MMGLSPSELYDLELREFFACHAGWLKREEQHLQQQWEVARYMAASIISPWMNSAKSIYEMLPLPWDAPTKVDAQNLDYDPNDMDARRAHVEKILNRQIL